MRRETPLMLLLLSLPVVLLGGGRNKAETFDVGCVCGPQCDCRSNATKTPVASPSDVATAPASAPDDGIGEVPEIEYQTEPEGQQAAPAKPQTPSTSQGLAVGSRRTINGVEQEVYKITQRGGTKTYHYRPVSSGGNLQSGGDCSSGTCPPQSRPRVFRW